jgi:hypothetical protein
VSHILKIVILASALLWTTCCFGSGRLEGTVRDSSEAVVPNTLIFCIGAETGFRFSTESDQNGNYALTVPDGRYNLIVRQNGFRPMVRIGVFVPGGGMLRVDFELMPNTIRQEMTVSDFLDQDGAAAPGSTVLSPDDLRALPRNDGAVTGLLSLVPGLVSTPANRGEPGQFSSLGARPNTNGFLVDGVSANSAVAGAGWPSLLLGGRLPAMTALGTTHDLAMFDSIQEVTVNPQSGIADAPGATIFVRTKSGTNDFHGSFFYNARPRALGASDWFANRYGLGQDAPALNEEGGSTGGPLRRDRTFFFVAAEKLAVRQGYAWTTTVPSELARAISPASLLSLLNEFPAPNGPELTIGISELIGENRLPGTLVTTSARIDHQFSPAERMFLRVAYTPSWTESGLIQTDLTQYRNQVATLGMTRSEGWWTHDSRLSFSRNEATSTWSVPEGGQSPSPAFYSQNPSLAAEFSDIVVGGAGSVSVGASGRSLQDQWQANHVSSFRTPRHEFRFGFEFLELQPSRSGPSSSVTVAFGTPTNLIYGPLAPVWATFSRPEANSTHLPYLSGFGQDTWRVSSRLNVTFAIGASWPKSPRVKPASNLYSVDDSTAAIQFTPILENQPLWGGSPVQLEPSVSAAWRLSGDTVLRASWAMYHDGGSAAALDQLNGIPYQQLQTPTGGPSQSYDASDLATVQLGYGYSRQLRLPVYQRWNVEIQHDWHHRDAVELSYAGFSGQHELRRELMLDPSAALGGLIFAAGSGSSQFHGLYAVYRRTLAAGLQANVSYGWSHSIDTNSSDSSVFLIDTVANAASDRGSSDFDLRHTLNAALTYSTPVQRSRGLAERMVSDWTFAAIVTAHTGFPVDVQLSETLEGFAVANYRPGLVPHLPLWALDSGAPGGRVLNPDAFAYPVEGLDALGRNVIRGFGMWQADLSAQHPVWTRDAFRASLRVDAYNAFNHAQFADPVRYASNPMFGQSQSALNLMFGSGSPGSGQSPAFLMGGPRSLQVSVRLSF